MSTLRTALVLASVVASLGFSVPSFAGGQATLQINGMHCEDCAKSLEARLKKINGVDSVRAKVTNEKAEKGVAIVNFKDDKVDPKTIHTMVAAVKDEGYEVQKFEIK